MTKDDVKFSWIDFNLVYNMYYILNHKLYITYKLYVYYILYINYNVYIYTIYYLYTIISLSKKLPHFVRNGQSTTSTVVVENK